MLKSVFSRDHVVSYNSENFKEMLVEFPYFNDELCKLKDLVTSDSMLKGNDIHIF